MIVGQSCDSAPFMQGVRDGLAAKIRSIVSHAVSTWYSENVLALVADYSYLVSTCIRSVFFSFDHDLQLLYCV